MKQPSPPTSGARDNEDKATAKLYVQKAAQAADELWQQTVGELQRPRVANPTVSALEHRNSTSQDEDSEDMDFSAPRKSRLSAPQLQAQLSRLTDRTRLRRLKSTFLSKGAWQQVTRIEDLCHTRVSHKWLYHFDVCAGSVLTPHDYIVTSSLWTVDLATMTTQTWRLTQPYQMTTMTSLPSPVKRSNLCSHQASTLPSSAPVEQFVSAL